MGQSIEEVLNRLVAVEDAAQQMQDAVDAQKKELAAQMEEKKKQFAGVKDRTEDRRTGSKHGAREGSCAGETPGGNEKAACRNAAQV